MLYLEPRVFNKNGPTFKKDSEFDPIFLSLFLFKNTKILL